MEFKTRKIDVVVDTPMVPPQWAMLERKLIQAQTDATMEFCERYFDERGYLDCYPRWGGDDGPDDAAENFAHWTELYALGAPQIILESYRRVWEGHLRQYTEAKTIEVPFARDGMYYREFPVMFDWTHNGEGFVAHWLEGLADPYHAEFRRRTRRYAGMYMGEDPIADNYDPKHKVIRSMFNGSRGPMMRKTTGLDWAGDPFEVAGRFRPAHGESNYQEMLDHFKDYNDVAGDHPLNLNTTTLALNAYMLEGEPKYREWVLGYIDAWMERTSENGGIIPTNIGLDGKIGGACDGKWYGGVYGWAHSTLDPGTQLIRHRPFFQHRAPWAFGNALMLSGNMGYLDAWRTTIDGVNSNVKTVDGQKMYPRCYGDDGWYDFRDEPFDEGALELYYWSMKKSDRDRVVDDPWISFLEGDNPRYPVEILEHDLEVVRSRMEGVRRDTASADTRMSDDMNHLTPAITGGLTQLMLGGLPTGREGHPLHARVRFFDPLRQRAGIPEDVAALVTGMTDTETTITLVNINQVEGRTAILQGGAYGEHQIVAVNSTDQSLDCRDGYCSVYLAPGSGSEIKILMNRYVNKPTLCFPWIS